MGLTVQAKLRCVRIDHPVDSALPVAILEPVTADSLYNESWGMWTPFDRIDLVLANPAACEALSPGREYLVSFEAV